MDLFGVKSDFECEFVEEDPNGRFLRCDEILGTGAFKTVYKAFDEVEGLEVGWSQVSVEDVLRTPEQLQRLYSEVHLLKSLKHENIIKFCSWWVDDTKKTINIITELFTSGSLRQYRRKHKLVELKAIKKWARQILQGLHYLHSHDPPIIHRDLKCDNIFVNGNQGEIKIGDLGLAIIMQQPTAHSVIGTLEFMAPELYDEEYNELVDIYSFGMCMLEMVTCEYPYNECKNRAQIYKNVTNGIKPASLNKVTDPQVRQFIEKCLVPASMRLPAVELLKDPFLAVDSTKERTSYPMGSHSFIPKLVNMTQPEARPMDVDTNCQRISAGPCRKSVDATSNSSDSSVLESKRFVENHCEFTLRAQKNADNVITLMLRIVDLRGRGKTIDFEFYPDSDTAISIAEEMAEQLDLSTEDVTITAELIDSLVMKFVPSWKPTSDSSSCGASSYGDQHAFQVDGRDWDSGHVKAASMISDISVENGINSVSDCVADIKLLGSDKSSFVECCYRGSDGYCSDLDCMAHCQLEQKKYKHDSCESFLIIDSATNSSPSSPDGSKAYNLSSISSLSELSRMEKHDGLKEELDSIDLLFQHRLVELLKMKEEAIHNATKKWMAESTK